jgi:hypothetical protein
MLPRLILIVLAAVGLCSQAEVELSPEARALIAPVLELYERLDREHAAAPARSDAEGLIQMGQIDQAARSLTAPIDYSRLPPEQARAASALLGMERRDLENQRKLKAMLPPEGWFLRSVYGPQAANAAFLIVQHAINDTELQRSALAAMEPLVAKGEVSGEAFGLLYDRRAMMDGRRQRYGSQMICHGNRWVLYPVEDPENVDARRKAAGFALTIGQNLARFVNRPSCLADWPGPIPQ